MTADLFTEVFSEHGTVESVNIIKDKETGKGKGFAFVTFSDSDSVDKCNCKCFCLLGEDLPYLTLKEQLNNNCSRRQILQFKATVFYL